MADVNLSVEVRSTGVAAAIAEIDRLRGRSMQTAAAMTGLAKASADAMTAISNSTQGATGRITGFNAAITATGKGSVSLARQLKELEAGYARLSKLDPNANAQQRITAFGGGNFEQGLSNIRQMIALQGALNPNAIADYNKLLRDRQVIETQTASRASAQANLERARWEASLVGMNSAQRAQERLTRATQEYTQAQRALDAAGRGANGRWLPQTADVIARQTQATNELARAQRNLTSAQQALNHERDRSQDNAFQSSYSYFILAGLTQQIASGIYGWGEASLTASAQIERSFADVERTFDGTESELSVLQQRLYELSTSTPSSVLDLSQIATLGNQLGVASSDIERFTQVIAQYTAVSGESAESAATAFGRISNLTGLAASQYGNLASAITYVARTTVATESTIQNTAKEISALAAGAGFSADAIVGLAGALSSLAIPPERARGALSLYFGALNEAVAEGGPKLAAFAELTGKTAEELNDLVRQNRGQEVFTAFIQGLSELDTVAKTSALDTLGLSTIRVDQTMRALAQNVPLVTQAFNGANQAFEAGTEISSQYALIQATLDSKWKEFQNSVLNVAAAMGGPFVESAKGALEVLTAILVEAQKFANSPIGKAWLTLIAGAAAVIAILASVVGVLALARASLVIFSFALSGIGWTTASKGLVGWIAGLLSADKATRVATANMTSLRVALAETTTGMSAATVGSRILAGALNLLKIALPIVAISAAIALWDHYANVIERITNPSKRLTDDLTGLKEALIADNQGLMPERVEQLGISVDSTGRPLSEFNKSILTAIAIQKQAEGALSGTNDQIDAQAFKLGETSKAWIADALKTQEDIADIINGSDVWETITETLFQPGTADEYISRDRFEKLLLGGLDLNEISQIAITQGKDAANAAYDAWVEGANLDDGSRADAQIFKSVILPDVLDSVVDAYGDAAVEAALAGNAISETGGVAVATAADFDTLGNYMGDAIENGNAVAVTFSGVTGRLDDFRDAIQGAIRGYVGFNDVLSRAEDAAQAVADAYNELHNTEIEPAAVDAAGFGAALDQATSEAQTFYEGIMALADGGNTSFALQLAELGPEAAGILSSALNLDSESQQKLEASARFAAFLASDAFKNELQSQMSDTNEAYAIIFKETGDLSQVQSYIAAQVSGVGAAWEQQWAIDHPSLPLNVTPEFVSPSEEQLQFFSDQLSGRITIKPNIQIDEGGFQFTTSNTYTDSVTGASITLPASLDDKALSASLAYWSDNQNLSPEEIASKLNTTGWNSDIDNYLNNRGPIKVYATLVPSGLGRYYSDPRNERDGGRITPNRRDLPAFASGGSYGMFRGPGSGISDSILARVSAGEFISTAAATKFWGPDFFDSLNRKMLPTSFLHMLGAAAVSGNRGPERVAHVQITQNNPVTRDPLKQLRSDSENVAAGIW